MFSELFAASSKELFDASSKASAMASEFIHLPPLMKSVMSSSPTIETQLTSLLLFFVATALSLSLLTFLLTPLISFSTTPTSGRVTAASDVLAAGGIRATTLAQKIDSFSLSKSKENYLNATPPTFSQFLLGFNTVPSAGGGSAVTVYLSDPARASLLFGCLSKEAAAEIAESLVHSAAGMLGLAAFMEEDEEKFMLLARFALLLEASLELVHYVSFLFASIITLDLHFSTLFTVLHHMALLTFLPVNLVVLAGPLGREVAAFIFLMYGFVAPVQILNTWKNNRDLTTEAGISQYMTAQMMQAFIYISTRFFGWFFVVGSVATVLWHDSSVSRSFAVGTSVVLIALTAVNFVICEFVRIGLMKSLEHFGFSNVFIVTINTETEYETITVVTEEFLLRLAEDAVLNAERCILTEVEERAGDIWNEEQAEKAARRSGGESRVLRSKAGRASEQDQEQEQEQEQQEQAPRDRKRHSSLFAPLIAKANARRPEEKKSVKVMGFDMKDIAYTKYAKYAKKD